MLSRALFAGLLVGLMTAMIPACAPPPPRIDADGDTFAAGEDDCDDGDAAIHPGATETCDDGIDQDCLEGDLACSGDTTPPGDDDTTAGDDDSSGDDDDTTGDDDSTGDDDDTTGDDDSPSADEDDDGWSIDQGDCDDDDPDVNPGADEQCNGVDDDCDDDTDEDVLTTFYLDDDGDGYGVTESTTDACTRPSGHAAQDGDCQDDDDEVYPGADERCNGVDDDCDASVDEGVKATWYPDADGDDHGVPGETIAACEEPSGYASTQDDCDDASALIYPGALELCDEIDHNCDGSVAGEPATFYADSDGDGYGDSQSSTVACAAGDAWVADPNDCDDTDASIHPIWVDQASGSNTGDGTPAAPLKGIQAGIDAATTCPLVLVGKGTYLESVMLEDRSGLTLTATGGASVTSIVTEDGLRPLTLEGVEDVTIEGFTLEATDPVNDDGGGLLVATSSDVVLRGLVVQGSLSKAQDGVGGGIAVILSEDIALIDSRVTGNSAPTGGGLAVISSAAIVAGCTFDANLANFFGGGIAVGAVTDGTPGSSLEVETSVISENAAGQGAAGVFVEDPGHDAEVRETLVASNTASEAFAGGVYNASLIERCTFIDNTALGSSIVANGGAVMIRQDATVSNSIFIGNRASYAGGIDVYQYDGGSGRYTIVNNTFVDNDGESYPGGDSIYLYSATYLTLESNIMANFSVKTEYNVYRLSNSSTWAIKYNDIYQKNGSAVGSGVNTDNSVIGANGNISVDPYFTYYDPGLPEKADLHLKTGSPCIDTGSPAATDPDGSRTDMGAYGGPNGG